MDARRAMRQGGGVTTTEGLTGDAAVVLPLGEYRRAMAAERPESGELRCYELSPDQVRDLATRGDGLRVTGRDVEFEAVEHSSAVVVALLTGH